MLSVICMESLAQIRRLLAKFLNVTEEGSRFYCPNNSTLMLRFPSSCIPLCMHSWIK